MALNPLAAISRFESGGRNIHQNVVPAGGGFNPSTGTVTGPSSAQGYFQITNSTWAGIPSNITQGYPNATSAPYSVQAAAAAHLYNQSGFQSWAPYNSNLRNYIADQGGAGAFAAPGTLSTDPVSYAAVDPAQQASGGFDPTFTPDPFVDTGNTDANAMTNSDPRFGAINNFGFDPSVGNLPSGLSAGNIPIEGTGDQMPVTDPFGTNVGTSVDFPSATSVGGSGGGLTYYTKPVKDEAIPPAKESVGVIGKVPDVANAIAGGFNSITEDVGAYVGKSLTDTFNFFTNWIPRVFVMVLAIVLILAAAWLLVPKDSKQQIATAIIPK